MASAKPAISTFFPFLNDWGTIGSLVLSLDQTLKLVASKYEIIIIDDGSDSRSKEILSFLKTKFPRLKIITHPKNLGYGGAVKAGIAASAFDWIFYTDGDAQYDPRELRFLLRSARPGIDIINGYKIKRCDPWYRILAGKTYHYVAKILFGLPLRDTDCDFRLMRKSIFKKVKLESNSGLICVEMIKKISDFGFKFEEVPIHHYWRISGQSQFFNFKRVTVVIFGLLCLWYKLVVRKEHLRHARLPTS